ncbi:hypothetical protein OPT61_g3598 [Boeremia exigua]|uniref:Uncharacterized protein n=1 Tax=Boeremia exigua TaxID=749465 RepID=A0ACC2IH90_9PLEO|nr:hypothetical protein OPT61_g3598 [Boeremia exigua]
MDKGSVATLTRPRSLPPGVYVPTPAFFDSTTEELEVQTTAKHVARLVGDGVAGIVVQGSNGEAVHLSRSERDLVTSTTRATLDKADHRHVPVIVGCSAQSVREVVELCEHAAHAGGDHALILPPSYYSGQFVFDTMQTFYCTIADLSPIPIIIYNYPAVASGQDLDSDTIIALAQHPNIVGCKLTCGNTGKMNRIISALGTIRPDFSCMGGLADFTLQTLVAGGSYVIVGLGNIAPKACQQIFKLYNENDMVEARRVQGIVARGDWALIRGGLVGVKACMEQHFGYGGFCRKPLRQPGVDEQAKWRQAFLEVVELERTLKMDASSVVVIIGAGLFGLSTAKQLATEGFTNIVVLDRHMVPVPDGSSVDISRVIRFDYADEEYLKLAFEAYKQWRDDPKYRGIFFQSPYILVGSIAEQGRSWIDKTTTRLDQHSHPWTTLQSATDCKQRYPTLSGQLASPGFLGYVNEQAGWADASKAITQLRDQCIELGVSFISGQQGTVIGFEIDATKSIRSVKTAAGKRIAGDHFILAAGAWGSGLVNMYNSTLTTAQALAYVRLTEAEVHRLRNLPIYANFCTGWFNFPPHEDTMLLKMAVHGWGYTRTPTDNDIHNTTSAASLPPTSCRPRANFVPADAEQRLRQGLKEILPELSDRPFERTALCWYTDTPTGDFIMDYHPDLRNLFVGGAGSGHAFKFLPILGSCMSKAIKGTLPAGLAAKWRFRKEYQHRNDVFTGDGSRGGPARRELALEERIHLEQPNTPLLAKL